MNLNLNVIGLGHPTRWHCSINNDFATKEEAEQLKADIELAFRIMDNTPIISAEDIDREPTEEDIKFAKEAEEYYIQHSKIWVCGYSATTMRDWADSHIAFHTEEEAEKHLDECKEEEQCDRYEEVVLR